VYFIGSCCGITVLVVTESRKIYSFYFVLNNSCNSEENKKLVCLHSCMCLIESSLQKISNGACD
jgi:hypothetical protein